MDSEAISEELDGIVMSLLAVTDYAHEHYGEDAAVSWLGFGMSCIEKQFGEAEADKVFRRMHNKFSPERN